jgi:hypothetical protein
MTGARIAGQKDAVDAAGIMIEGITEGGVTMCAGAYEKGSAALLRCWICC